MRQYFILLVITPFLLSCKNGNKMREEPNGVMIDTMQYALILCDPVNVRIYDNTRPADLSPAEIIIIEEVLRLATGEYNRTVKDQDLVIRPLDEYKKRLLAATNINGGKLVWINCFCGKEWGNYRKEIFFVEDGGSCYFNVKINPATKKAFDLLVNGLA
jgi:hypothetical protein